MRLDSILASGYWAVTEDGLFQLGHSKDHRPDLPQVKVMLSALDPLGMSVALQVLSGERADDPLYIPAIAQVREGVKQEGLLYVGDCKMAALQTRAFTQAGGDFYLCPLPAVQLPDTELESYFNPVWSGEQVLMPIYRQKGDGTTEQIAKGYKRTESLSAVVDGKRIDWIERRLVIRSLQQAEVAEAGLQARMNRAQTAPETLNERKPGRTHFRDIELLRQAAEAIVTLRLEGLPNLSYEEVVKERRLQRYGKRPAGVRVERFAFISRLMRKQ